MEKLEIIWSAIKNFLLFKVYGGNNTIITISTLLTIFFGLILATYVLKLAHRIIISKLPEDDKNKFISIFGFLKYLLYTLLVITVLQSSGVDLTVFLTASAALFVGLGFALQHLFQDIISGILIILDQSLHVGDIIEVEGKVGRVFEIRLRTTRALTRDDKVIVIPNHKFLTNSIYNYTQNYKTTRESVKVGVAYGSDIDFVTKILIEIAFSLETILNEPKPFVIFEDFGDSSLVFVLNFYIEDSYNDPKIKSEVRYKIATAFREQNITIPFPQRDIHIIDHNVK